MTSDLSALHPVKVLGRTGCAVAYTIRDFLHRSDIPFDWIELRTDDQARSDAGVDSLTDERLPL